MHRSKVIWILLGLVLAAWAPARAAPEERAAEHQRRAAEYVQEGKLQEAAIELRNAVQLKPNDPEPHRALADVYLKLKDPQNAFREYQEVVSLAPADADARVKVATFYYLGKRFADAETNAAPSRSTTPSGRRACS